MTEQRQTEDERIRWLLAAAAEAPGGGPAVPGADFTAHARRGLVRRRVAAAAGAAAVAFAVTVGAVSVLRGAAGEGEAYPVASAPCLRSTVEILRAGGKDGFGLVHGQLRADGLDMDMDDGVTAGSVFRFDVEGALTRDGGVPSSGPVLTWYPVSESQLPRPGRYVLLLAEAERPAPDGRRLFDYRPEDALPVRPDGQVVLPCADGGKGTVELDRLRAAVAADG
ncbi:hypothetical protein ACFVU3_03245 [Streptomyces sp. NPDC058052]|uniref:hypothetical protein n=1 Tax=Streptomyces sp. NPDC058052 TaxID=3346316 RepID=UPI0036E5914E